MKRPDKLGRYRTIATSLLTQVCEVPFWVSLTPSEKHGKHFAHDLKKMRKFLTPEPEVPVVQPVPELRVQLTPLEGGRLGILTPAMPAGR